LPELPAKRGLPELPAKRGLPDLPERTGGGPVKRTGSF